MQQNGSSKKHQAITIECYLSSGCQSEDALRTVIAKALEDEGLKGEVKFHRIDDERAERLNLRGSPSVFINGAEVQPADMRGFS